MPILKYLTLCGLYHPFLVVIDDIAKSANIYVTDSEKDDYELLDDDDEYEYYDGKKG